MLKFYRKSVSLSDLWVSSNDKLSDFYASSWQRGESPVPLLVVRIVLASLALSILVWSLVEGNSAYWLIYLTNWGLLLVTLMTLSGLLVSCFAISKKTLDYGPLPWYMSMYWTFYNLAVTIAITITALYWILLYDPETKLALGTRAFLLDVATHGVNSCVAIVEVLVSRTPVRILHFYQPLGAALWYVVFSAVYYAAGGTDINGFPYIYELLDWRNGRQSGILVTACAAGVILIYLVLWGLAACRDKISVSLVRTISMDLPLAPPDQHMTV